MTYFVFIIFESWSCNKCNRRLHRNFWQKSFNATGLIFFNVKCQTTKQKFQTNFHWVDGSSKPRASDSGKWHWICEEYSLEEVVLCILYPLTGAKKGRILAPSILAYWVRFLQDYSGNWWEGWGIKGWCLTPHPGKSRGPGKLFAPPSEFVRTKDA